MGLDRYRSALLVGLATGAGVIAWWGHALLLPAALYLPLIWSQSPTRMTASLVATGYFLAASRGLPIGVAQFYATDLWLGSALWIAAAACFVILHTLLWTKRNGWVKPGRYLLILLLTGLPPFGITGWAHPLTATGIVFPGWGWWGLIAATAALIALLTRFAAATAIVLSALWLWSAVAGSQAITEEAWHGIDLQMGASLGRDPSLQRQKDLVEKVTQTAGSGEAFVVLPESALGFWTPTIERVWRDELQGSRLTVIAGATVLMVEGYDNVMVAINADGGHLLYHQRMPVPVSMWRPWARWTGGLAGAHAGFFVNPVLEVAGKRIAPLICYEQLVLWPILQSMFYRPDLIVLIGNGWWTTGTNIIAIQRASAKAWSALFGIPLVMSFNT